MSRLGIILIALAVCLLPAPARAHRMRSAYLEIDERAPGSALVRLRSAVPDAPLSAAIEGCTASGEQANQTDAGSRTTRT